MVATFPYELVTGDYYTTLFRLLRLVHIGDVLNLINLESLKPIIEWIYKDDTRGKRVLVTFFFINFLKIVSLIMAAITIVYFLGCLWFTICATLNSSYNVDHGTTFILSFGLNLYPDDYDRFITSCYYIITTLAVIGYGDLYPETNVERIFCMAIMIFGVAFFAFIMGQFISFVTSLDDLSAATDESTDLHQWLKLLSRFAQQKSLSLQLRKDIDDHFKHYWANDRMVQVNGDNYQFLQALPKSLKKNIMVQFLYDDVFYNFKNFFKTRKYADSKFLYDIAFNLSPRVFFPEAHRCLIYSEEDEVAEMYFIMKGEVGIGFQTFGASVSDRPYKIGVVFGERRYIGDFYVSHNRKAQFVYACLKEVHAFSLSKKYLQGYIFDKYPDIADEIRDDALNNYRKFVMGRLLRMRREHLEEVNKNATYKVISVVEREKSQVLDVPPAKKSKNDLHAMLQTRLHVIEEEMIKLQKHLKEMVGAVDVEQIRFV